MGDIGLKQGTVQISNYNPKWKEFFEQEKRLLLERFPEIILDVSHGGSTAIPNMPAKPIIDIFALVNSLSDVEKIKTELEDLGYTYRGEEGVPDRILYVKGPIECRTHHLQFVEKESDSWNGHILLRAYYMNHPEIAQEYAKLKMYLAEKFPNDRKSYTHSKDDFIKSVLNKAKDDIKRN